METLGTILITFVISAILALSLIGVMSLYSIPVVKQEAIEKGYAMYCPKGGEWAWIGECKE